MSNNPRKYKYKVNTLRLPHPAAFYGKFGINLRYGKDWQKTKCPFHDDTNPSLSINYNHGGFCCHACGMKGNMIEFYKNYHHVDFWTACKQLDLIQRD